MAPKAVGRGRRRVSQAQAKAARRRLNEKRDGRRAALSDLNALAEEVGAAVAQVDARAAPPEQVERTVHFLEGRCQQPALAARLRAAVQKWVDNGGQLQGRLTPAPDLSSLPALFKHRVLQPEFRCSPAPSC